MIERRLGRNWSAISGARHTTDEILSELRDAVSDLEDRNYSIVVTGSLGRREACRDSDADWMLLVDGPSNPDHAEMARAINARISKVLPAAVGETRTFGEIVVSHDLVHYIAGTKDSNLNLTRRMLLLAESRSLSNDLVRQRVIRNVLARYVIHDRSLPRKDGKRHTIPHFLLNDVVRYWRTIASDFASKMWERDRKEWGIRNIKLRFSRKLLFIWGLLATCSLDLFPSSVVSNAKSEEEYLMLLQEHIRERTDVEPLELLARVIDQIEDKDDEQATKDHIADQIFTSYDRFLLAMSNPEERNHLKSIRFEDATSDPLFDELRACSRTFRAGLSSLMFDRHPVLRSFIKDFGVF